MGTESSGTCLARATGTRGCGRVVGAGLGPGRGGGGGDCRGGCLIACEFAGAAPGGRATAQRGCARGVAGACVRWWATVRARPPVCIAISGPGSVGSSGVTVRPGNLSVLSI